MEIDLFDKIGKQIDGALRKEFAAQGHSLTGKLEKSINGTVLARGYETTLNGVIYNYGQILNYGTTAARIPFYPGSGNKTSKYIAGLIAYWKARKGLDDKEAKAAAFATAYKQKGRGNIPGEGMPTVGSYAFSSTGERKRFIEIVADVLGGPIEKQLSDGFDSIVHRKFNETKSETI